MILRRPPKATRVYLIRLQRWLGAVPEVGDTRGWIVHFVCRLPISLLVFFGSLALVLTISPIGLRVWSRGDPNTSTLTLALVGLVLLAVVLTAFRALLMWTARKRELDLGAMGYTVIRVKRSGLKLGYKNQRLWLPWHEVDGASAGLDGFELRWGMDGRLFGVHVSPSQSTLLPSGELPDDASMAAWINERKSEIDAGRS